MSTGPISELVIPYDPGPLTAKVERRRRLIRMRLISLGITIALLGLIYLWRREDLGGSGLIIIFAIVLGVSLAWLKGISSLRATSKAPAGSSLIRAVTARRMRTKFSVRSA